MTINLIIPESKKDSLSFKSEGTFLKRLRLYTKVNVLPFKPEKNGGASFKRQKDEEKILKILPKDSQLILCDETGKNLNTVKLLEQIEKKIDQKPSLTFIIGGPYGLSDLLKDKADLKIKLSDLTMNSDLATAVLWEQLYRIFSLRAGHPYHND